MTYTHLGILEMVCALVVIGLEIPTGVFADFLGKKWSVFAGCVLWSAALFIIGVGSTFPVFLAGFLIWGSSDAFLSGAYSALLYDTLKKVEREHEYLKIKGRLLLISSFSLVVGSILGAYIYQVHNRLPWFLNSICILTAAGIILSMKEPYATNTRYTLKNQIEHMKTSLKFSFTHKDIKFLIVFSVLLLMPVSIFTNLAEQPYLISLGFSVVSLGVIYAVTRGIIGAISPFIYRIERKLGEKLSFFLVSSIYSVGFVLLGLLKMPVMVICMTVLYLSRDYTNAVMETYINNHVESQRRATVLSIRGFSLNIAYMVYVLIGGIFLDILPLNTVLVLLGFGTFVITVPYLVLRYRKVQVRGKG